jgi:hypothetical protein
MEEDQDSFKFTSLFIKLISAGIAIAVIFISVEIFMFFLMAMIPSILAIALDNKSHRCGSATICTFNLTGALPYLFKLTATVGTGASYILKDFKVWTVIYISALVGWLFIAFFPTVVSKIYLSKAQIQVRKYDERKKNICERWGITYDAIDELDE